MGKWLLRILALLVAAVLIAVFVAPTIADQRYRTRDAELINAYSMAVANAPPDELKALRDECADCNAQQADLEYSDPFTSAILYEDQSALLDDLGRYSDGVLCVLTVPKLGVTLPVYRSSDKRALDQACAFVEGTSLPVGTAAGNTVLAAKGGWLEARRFGQLDNMRIGDLFYVDVLGKRLTFTVDRTNVVNQPSSVTPERDRVDAYCTLIMCPSEGSNSRTLVRGRLTTDRLTMAHDSIATVSDLRTRFALGAPIAAVIAALLIVHDLFEAIASHRRRRRQKKRMRAELNKF